MYDVVVIGGGQAGLAIGYYLSKTKLNYVILDENPKAGGAWLHTWDSLSLFSPSNNSSLPGWFMPKSQFEYPTKNEVIDYLEKYESRYKLNIIRNTKVLSIETTENIENTQNKSIAPNYLIKCINNPNELIKLEDITEYNSKYIINATGNFNNPYIPDYKNKDKYLGEIIHSAQYRTSLEYIGKKVLIVGGANSAAQILAEVSLVANAKWATLKPPVFLPDNIDGRDLFHFATAAYQRGEKKNDICGVNSLGDIVMIPSVKEARDRNLLISSGKISDFYYNGVIWESENGEFEEFDVVIFCTGFKNNLFHLKNLNNMFDENGKVVLNQRTINTENKSTENLTTQNLATGIVNEQIFESLNYPNIYFIGFGNWTGFASATLIGVGRFAKLAVADIVKKNELT